MHFENGKGRWQIDDFCIFAKVAIVTMSNFVKFILGTSWTNMEAQEEFVLQFHLNLFLERENGQFVDLISFLSSLFKIFFWFTFLVKCKCYAYDANDMIKC